MNPTFFLRSFVAISDVHFSLTTLEVATEVLRQALSEASQRGVPLVIAGDLNDTKAILRSETILAITRLFEDQPSVIKLLLVGNHDLDNIHSKNHSLEFAKRLSNTFVIDEPRGYGSWYFIPYLHNEDAFKAAYEEGIRLNYKYFVIHQGVRGARMGHYVTDSSSVDASMFSKATAVLSGHYHETQQLPPNFCYFGSPYTINFAEAGDYKFIWHVEEKEGSALKMLPIETSVRRHLQFEFVDSLPAEAPLIPKNALVKVVLKGPKEFALKVTKQQLQEFLKVENITVVSNIVKQSVKRMEIKEDAKPTSIIWSYLDSATTQYDKKELKQFLEGALK